MQQVYRANLEGKCVLELGAGLGLCGIGIAALGADVVLTDRQSIAEGVLRHNINANADIIGKAHAEPLEWGRSRWAGPPRGITEWDIIIASDCIYTKSTQIALRFTLKQLIAPGSCTRLIVSYVRRSCQCDTFAKYMQEDGFTVDVLSPDDVSRVAGVQSKVWLLLIQRPH